MTKPVRRPGSAMYYARRSVPKHLRKVVGRAEFWLSLETPNLDVAKRLERAQQQVWDRLFSEAEDRVSEQSTPTAISPPWHLSEHEVEGYGVMERHFADIDAKADADPIFSATINAAAAIRDHAVRQEFIVDLKAEDALKGRKSNTKGVALATVIDLWVAQKQPAEKTADRMRAVVKWFRESVGEKAVEAITSDDIETFKTALLARATPVNARVKLRNLSTLLQFAVSPGRLIKANPAAHVTVSVRSNPAEDRTNFDAAALSAIFCSPIYTADSRPKGGAGEAAYWLPLLALFTGARLEEIGQLRPCDVLQETYLSPEGEERSAWVIRIIEDADEGLFLKNAYSARRVPLHNDLVRLGFLDFAKSQPAVLNSLGFPRLFPSLRPDKYGTETANFSKWFNRYLREVCGVADRRMVFHSFRHGFKHFAREVGIHKEVHDALTGHKGRDAGDTYGNIYFPLAGLVSAIERYRAPGFRAPTRPPSLRDEAT